MSSYVAWSVPRTSGRSTPSSMPLVTPRAPGKRPNRWSNVRFSLIKKTTCLIGQRVSNVSASTAVAADGDVTTGDGATACGDDGGEGESEDTTGSSDPEHATATDAHVSIATS